MYGAVALVCVLAQLAVGASALGLIVCTGRDHAAIELGSDDCCTGGKVAGRTDHAATLTDRCCSDTPLFAAARQVSDVRRSQPPSSPVLLALVAPRAAAAAAGERHPASALAFSASSRLALRSVILRV